MIHETSRSEYDTSDHIPSINESQSHSRNRDYDVMMTSFSGKRQKLGTEFDDDVILRQSVTVDSENVPSVNSSGNNDKSQDLKVECVSDDVISKDASVSSVIHVESKLTESLSSSSNKENIPSPSNEATSQLTVKVTAPEMPSAAELEEFFTEAEKYQQKRFVEKYNFDIVKGVPLEGRYEWFPLKP